MKSHSRFRLPRKPHLALAVFATVCLTACDREPPSKDRNPAGSAPPDLASAYQERVRSGKWTHEQGMVESLRVLAGERRAREVFGGKPVAVREGTGFLHAAHRYLGEGSDEATKTELRRLTHKILPAYEWLWRNSRPVDKVPAAGKFKAALPAGGARPGWGLIAEARADPTCAELLAADQPPRAALEARSDCFDRLTRTLPGGNLLTLYYPTRWRWGSPRLRYVEPAAEAVAESFRRYQSPPPGLSAHGDVYVVFGEHEERDREERALATASAPGGLRCGISVWRYSYRDDLDAFRQTIAHETFHCFQFWQELDLNIKLGVSDWWFEATAEYFGNVVYPCTDGELGFLPDFQAIGTKTIFETGYGNFVFFQYLANRDGIAAVMRLNRDLAYTPLAGQPGRFASWPDMSPLFREFAQSYVDGSIRDACPGRTLPTPPRNTLNFAHGQEYEFAVPHFSIPLIELDFDEDPYRLSKRVSSGGPPQDSARERADARWAALPEIPNPATSACLARPKNYLWFPLNTGTDSAALAFVLRDESTAGAAGSSAGAIDRCLVGRWEMDSESVFAFGSWIEERASHGGTNPVRFQGASGAAVAELTARGRAFGDIQALQPSAQIQHPERQRGRRRNVAVPARTDEIAVHINGSSCARWSVEAGMLKLTDIQEQIRVISVTKIGDRTITQDLSPGAAATTLQAAVDPIERMMSAEKSEAAQREWRETVARMRDALAERPAPPAASEPMKFRYRCRGDGVELEWADMSTPTPPPPVRMLRRSGAGGR